MMITEPAIESVRAEIAANLAEVRQRVANAAQHVGRSPSEVILVAVSKTFPAEPRLRAAYEAGQRVLGENRVQEALEKQPQLPADIEWHLIGTLQTNKARHAVNHFVMIHSIDSLRLASVVDREAARAGKRMPVLLEVNVGGEESKHGFDPENLPGQVAQLVGLSNLEIQGLMTVPPLGASPEVTRPYFQRLRALRDRLRRDFPGVDWRHLSMGMTNDFEVAIEEGATIVRVGRAIFGERAPRGGQA